LRLTLGQIVISQAGRDIGRRFVVVRLIDDLFVEISDGDLRRAEKPKRKKIKHLKATDDKVLSIEEKLKSGIRVTNAEMRKALAGLEIQQNNE
jgi:large subunit ribosomal protein L14e